MEAEDDRSDTYYYWGLEWKKSGLCHFYGFLFIYIFFLNKYSCTMFKFAAQSYKKKTSKQILIARTLLV